MRRISSILAALTVVLAFGSVAAAGGLKPGDVAPDFTLKDQNGAEVSLKDFEGKTVVLEWVNPDCPFVQRHYKADTMTSLATKWAEQGVVWLSINSTKYMGVEDNMKFVKAEGIEHPVLSDTSGETGHAYGAMTTPHMFVISGEGKVLYNGAIDDDRAGSSKSPNNYVDAALSSVSAGSEIEHAQTKPYGCSVKYAEKAEAKAKASSR